MNPGKKVVPRNPFLLKGDCTPTSLKHLTKFRSKFRTRQRPSTCLNLFVLLQNTCDFLRERMPDTSHFLSEPGMRLGYSGFRL